MSVTKCEQTHGVVHMICRITHAEFIFKRPFTSTYIQEFIRGLALSRVGFRHQRCTFVLRRVVETRVQVYPKTFDNTCKLLPKIE